MTDTLPLREQIARLIEETKTANEKAAKEWREGDFAKGLGAITAYERVLALLPSLPDGWAGPTYEDACRLSRAFNQSANLRDDQDRRINEWIKTLIQQSQIAARPTVVEGSGT